MCTSPKIIKNPRKHFICGVDREYIKVPCGSCFECRNKKRNEIYVLSYYEHLQAVAYGGFTQFFTLTYKDSHLPTHGFRPCFSREDIKSYIRRVNSASKRLFGNAFRFRYLVTCEYGDNTHRPHYHCLFFVQNNVNSYEFRKILRDCWPHGWSLGSFDNFGVINRPEGIRYVTKYVAKDMFDIAYDAQKLDECKEYSERAFRSAQRVLPFTFRSKGYGRFGVAHVIDGQSLLPAKWRTSVETLLDNKIIVPSIDGSARLVELPRSLQRLLFYNCNYRYKKITPKYREECDIRGTVVPHHRVESHYIPNLLYPEWKKKHILSCIDKDSSNVKVYNLEDCRRIAVYRWLSPDYSFRSNKSSLTFEDYLDKYIHIQCVRSPVYYRDPFDNSKFLVNRYELDINSVPDMVKYLESSYDSSLESVSRDVDLFLFKDLSNRKVSSDGLEKSYRDIKTLKYYVKLSH